MTDHFKTLEFDTIREQLADCAVSEGVKVRCRAITPATTRADAMFLLNQTTEAKRMKLRLPVVCETGVSMTVPVRPSMVFAEPWNASGSKSRPR